MPDSDDLRAEVEAVCTGVERRWQVQLTLHAFGEALRDAQGASVVPAVWRQHRARICQRAKQSGGNPACRTHDLDHLPRLYAESTRPTWHTCHAGKTELIAPVHLGGRLEALWYLGPLRSVNDAQRAEVMVAAHLLRGWLADLAARLAAGRSQGGDRRLTRITAFLDAHLTEDPDLAALARHLGLSSERTRHLIREATGHSFRALKDHYRLARAHRQLADGWRSVAEVGRHCGFTDPAWFGRWFRSRSGQSPGAWRTTKREA